MPPRGLNGPKRRDTKGMIGRRINKERSIPGLSLEEEALDDPLLYGLAPRPAYFDGYGLPASIRAFPGAVLLTRENLGPDVVESGNIKDVGKAKLPADTQYGRPSSGNMEYKDASIPKRAIEAVGWDQVDDKPGILTHGEAKVLEDRMRRFVKNYAQPKKRGN